MAWHWMICARQSEKPRQSLCFAGLALHVWLKRWNIPCFEEPFCQNCGKQYNGDLHKFGFWKSCNKRHNLQTPLDCMGTFTVLFFQISTDIVSGCHVWEFWSVFSWKGECSAKAEPFYDGNTQESDTTDITDQIKDLFSCEMLHSWFNSQYSIIPSHLEEWQVWPSTKNMNKQYK